MSTIAYSLEFTRSSSKFVSDCVDKAGLINRGGLGNRKVRLGYRRGARFVRDMAECSIKLDRNARSRILCRLEVLARTGKGRGYQNGIVTQPTLRVGQVLLNKFYNTATGFCFPSYDALQKATGFCRDTVARALAGLEDLGLLWITRRLVRAPDALGRLVAR